MSVVEPNTARMIWTRRIGPFTLRPGGITNSICIVVSVTKESPVSSVGKSMVKFESVAIVGASIEQ